MLFNRTLTESVLRELRLFRLLRILLFICLEDHLPPRAGPKLPEQSKNEASGERSILHEWSTNQKTIERVIDRHNRDRGHAQQGGVEAIKVRSQSTSQRNKATHREWPVYLPFMYYLPISSSAAGHVQ